MEEKLLVKAPPNSEPPRRIPGLAGAALVWLQPHRGRVSLAQNSRRPQLCRYALNFCARQATAQCPAGLASSRLARRGLVERGEHDPVPAEQPP